MLLYEYETMAYDRGHWAGQSEVDCIAIGMVNEFKPCLEKYLTRVNKHC